MKTSDLTGPALDWAVATCMDVEWWAAEVPQDGLFLDYGRSIRYTPSTDWSQGGPIIEREGIRLHRSFVTGCWWADPESDPFGPIAGPTPLIAAMRCLVASRLGDTIDIPEELQ